MLVNLQEILRLAEEHHCAIGSFNVYNVESVQAVLKARMAGILSSWPLGRSTMHICRSKHWLHW